MFELNVVKGAMIRARAALAKAMAHSLVVCLATVGALPARKAFNAANIANSSCQICSCQLLKGHFAFQLGIPPMGLRRSTAFSQPLQLRSISNLRQITAVGSYHVRATLLPKRCWKTVSKLLLQGSICRFHVCFGW